MVRGQPVVVCCDGPRPCAPFTKGMPTSGVSSLGQVQVGERERGRRADAEGGFRGHAPVVVLHVVPVRHVGGLAHDVEPERRGGPDRLVDVQHAPVLVVAADVGDERTEGVEARRLC